MKKSILAVSLVAFAAFAWALPSTQEVEAEVQQGHIARAEAMMNEVVAAKPGSARAHYIYAEILARGGKLPAAAEEAKAARRIDPKITFADPDKFRSFENMLARFQEPAAGAKRTPAPAQTSTQMLSPSASPVAPPSRGVPIWVWLAGLGGVGFLVWRLTRSRAAPVGLAGASSGIAAPANPNYPGTPPSPVSSGPISAAGYPPAAAAASSGMLGVGLAAAGGVAAGMLAGEMLNHRQGQDPAHGLQPGSSSSPLENNVTSDLGERPIDFGTGGSDWESGSDDGGGASDGAWD